METCEDILRTKGGAVYAIAAEASVLEAVQAMCARRIGAVLVGDPARLLGILSERDVMTRVVLRHLSPDETRGGEVMTRDVVSVDPRTTQRDAMALMTRVRCRHLPVVANGRIVGVVSIGDLVHSASREQEFEVRVLTEYICGVPG
jgi:signal-transduction protein with cAMP-binding, CBS, and nucleotidyltransferase domain